MAKSLVVLLALCACSSTLNGMLSFTPNTELAGGNLEDGGVVGELIILLASLDEGSANCGQSNPVLAGQLLIIDLVSTPIVLPGLYPVSDTSDAGNNGKDAGNVAFVSVVTTNDGGQNKLGGGLSGSVTLTQVAPLTTGSFSATMVLADGGSGGNLSGSFNATFCGK
jgi:hypothetical protein